MSKMKSIKSDTPITINEKPAKLKKVVPKADRTHFDVFSKLRGYLCTCPDEQGVHRALQALFEENEDFWRNAKGDGKKSRAFDCYGVARTGNQERIIELMFAPDEDESERDTYEDITAKENA